MRINFWKSALADYVHFQAHEPKIAAKIDAFIVNIMRDPYHGLGKPEPLKHDYSGCWSRRINREHRLVYRIEGDVLFIIQCRFHYTQN